jgi:hypothetical protein
MATQSLINILIRRKYSPLQEWFDVLALGNLRYGMPRVVDETSVCCIQEEEEGDDEKNQYVPRNNSHDSN